MKFILLILSLFVVILYGCSSSKTDTQNYQDPALMNYKVNTIAVLPIRNSYLGLGESKEINRYYITGVSRKISQFKIIGPDEAIEKLNKDSLVEKYYNYLVAYSSTGIPNTDVVKEVGNSLGADVIIQGEIYGISKKEGDTWGFEEGKTSCKVRYSMASAKDGKVIWETTTEASDKSGALSFSNDAPALMDVIKLAMDEIIDSMPRLKK